jgi:hypothetical protein
VVVTKEYRIDLPSFHDCLLAFEDEYPVQFHFSTANKTGNMFESNIILS